MKYDAPHQSWCPLWHSPTLKIKHSSRKRFLEKKSETVINTCLSLIKHHWKKMVEIPQKLDFFIGNIHNFKRKVKQFVKKYYTICLIDLANKLYDVEKFFDFFMTRLLWWAANVVTGHEWQMNLSIVPNVLTTRH